MTVKESGPASATGRAFLRQIRIVRIRQGANCALFYAPTAPGATMTLAYLIDAEAREIRPVHWDNTVEGLRRFVGGSIDIAAILGDGDVIYVDDDGLQKPHRQHFTLGDNPQPLAGNGICVGRELIDHTGRWVGNAPPAICAAALGRMVAWLDDAAAAAWFTAHAADPAMTITRLDGSPPTIVATWADIVRRDDE